MLAEPRQKQRISSDPQNLNWQNDTNAFGKKMMKRMGWRDGCGLGKNGKGISENVRQSANHTQRGLGFNGESCESNWTANDDEFSRLLAELNEKKVPKECAAEEEPSKLEEAQLKKKKLERNSVTNIHRKRRIPTLSSEQKTAIFGRTQKLVKSNRSTLNIGEKQEEITEKALAENLMSSSVTMDVYFARKKASKSLSKVKEIAEKSENRRCSPTGDEDEQRHQLNEHRKLGKPTRTEKMVLL